LKFIPKIVRLPLFAVFLISFVFVIEVLTEGDFSRFGIYPKDPKGLLGVPLGPFIHGSLEHLYNNATVLFVLLLMMQYFYRKQTYFVLLVGIFFSGFFVWLIGRPSFHIGASGVIYSLVSFILFKGILIKNYRLVALSFIVIFFYGGMIWYMFPDVKSGISWEGHLGGFLSGIITAFWLETPDEYKKTYRYDWEDPGFNPYKDSFMKHFDEKGNFVSDPHTHTTNSKVKIKYHYTKDNSKYISKNKNLES